MAISQAKRKANDKCDKENMKVISVKMTKKFAENIDMAVEYRQISRNALIKNAKKEKYKKKSFCSE